MSVPWLTLMGIMLDASNLLATTVNEKQFSHSRFFLSIGTKSVQIFSAYFNLRGLDQSVSREDFSLAYNKLKEHGFELHDEDKAWEMFHLHRGQYAPALNALAANFVCPLPAWPVACTKKERELMLSK